MGRRVIAVAVAVVVLLGAGIGVAVARRGDRPARGPNSTVPFAERRRSAIAWTGKELIVVGGEAPAPRGERKTVGGAAAYSPQTGRWRSLANPPFDPPMRFLAAVWTGRELVVVGMPCTRTVPTADDHGIACKPARRRAAVYDPRRDRWRRIPMPAVGPANTEPLTTAIGWTGTLAAFRMADRDQSLWAYAPATSRWSKLATPGSLEDVLVCSHGGRLEIVPIPQLGHGYCAGSHIVVMSGGRGAQALGRYDIEARAWQDVASPPRDPGVNPEMVWTGSELVVMNSDVTWGPHRTFPRSRVYMAYDPAKDTWRDLETPGDWNLHGALWAGDRVLIGVTSQQFRTFTLEPMRAIPPRPEERDATAAAYWRYWQQRHVGSDVTPVAPNSVDAAVVAGGPDAVALIVALAEAAPSDDDARTLAVGPLAQLVARHWDRVEVEVGAAGRRSPRFRMALCSARGAAPSAAVDRLLAPQPCI